jgi:hypothetical protein
MAHGSWLMGDWGWGGGSREGGHAPRPCISLLPFAFASCLLPFRPLPQKGVTLISQNTLHFSSFGIIIAVLIKSTLPFICFFHLQTMTKGGVDAQR